MRRTAENCTDELSIGESRLAACRAPWTGQDGDLGHACAPVFLQLCLESPPDRLIANAGRCLLAADPGGMPPTPEAMAALSPAPLTRVWPSGVPIPLLLSGSVQPIAERPRAMQAGLVAQHAPGGLRAPATSERPVAAHPSSRLAGAGAAAPRPRRSCP